MYKMPVIFHAAPPSCNPQGDFPNSVVERTSITPMFVDNVAITAGETNVDSWDKVGARETAQSNDWLFFIFYVCVEFSDGFRGFA